MNFSAVKNAVGSNKDNTRQFKIAEPGAYMGYIEKCEVKESKNQNLYYSLQIALTDAEGKARGKLWTCSMLAGTMAFRTKRLMLAAGLEIPDGEADENVIAEQLTKREITVVVKHNEDDTKLEPDFSNWEGYYPITEFDSYNEMVNQGIPQTQVVGDWITDTNVEF